MSDHDLSNLASKLAEKWHLNVPERNSLPAAGLPASAFVDAVRRILNESPWYPSDWPRDEPEYDGAVITPNGNGFAIHVRHEIGVMHFSDATTTQVPTLEEAVRTLLKATFKADSIDGVPIDWSSYSNRAIIHKPDLPRSCVISWPRCHPSFLP